VARLDPTYTFTALRCRLKNKWPGKALLWLLHFFGLDRLITALVNLNVGIRDLGLSRHTNADIAITRIDEFDDAVDQFWDSVAPQFHAIVQRNSTYLNWKYVQQPIRYDGDVEVMNSNADKEEQLVDLAQYLAGKAMRGLRIKLEKMFANGGSTTTTLYNDTGKNFNSLVHALKHVAAVENYGALSRGYTPGTRNWWQGADQGTGGASQIVQNIASGTSWTSYQGTATTLSIAALRSWVIPIQHSIKAKRDIMFVMCPTLYNKLKAECQAMMIYEPDKGDDVAKVGFNRMYKIGRAHV